MNAVWKFPLEIRDRQIIEIPAPCKLLFVAEHGGRLCLWAQINPANPNERRIITIVGAGDGHVDPDWFHIGSAICAGGTLVWHVYDAGSP